MPRAEGPLLDTRGRPLGSLRLSVTDRCNLRCAYCMPEEEYAWLPSPDVLSFEELAAVVDAFVATGVRKVRLTGGEPLVRRDLPALVRLLAARPLDDLALTTNGVLLAEQAEALHASGLRRVTVSIDTLRPERFEKLTRRNHLSKVLAGIAAARRFGELKLDTVVMRGVNDDELVPLLDLAADAGAELRFIEYMDVGTRNGWRMDHVVPADEIVERVGAELPLVPLDRSYDSETALRFGFADGVGEIGVIASVTRPFCGACSRLRLSPEGQIYTCLFAIHGVDLRDPLRAGASDAELTHLIQSVWRARTDRYSELRGRVDEGEKIEMYYIGG